MPKQHGRQTRSKWETRRAGGHSVKETQWALAKLVVQPDPVPELTGEPQDERTACRRIRPQRRPERDGSARDQGWQAVWHRAAHLAGAELPPRKFAAILQNPAGVQRGLKSRRHPKQEAGRTA